MINLIPSKLVKELKIRTTYASGSQSDHIFRNHGLEFIWENLGDWMLYSMEKLNTKILDAGVHHIGVLAGEGKNLKGENELKSLHHSLRHLVPNEILTSQADLQCYLEWHLVVAAGFHKLH